MWCSEELSGTKRTLTDYSRRDKSLGLLCTNFVQTYGKFPAEPQSLSLDKVAEQLGVERRRIYDIGKSEVSFMIQNYLNFKTDFNSLVPAVNILEALEFVARQRKNTYLWMGARGLRSTLRRLQHEAIGIWPKDAAAHGITLAKGRKGGPPAPLDPSVFGPLGGLVDLVDDKKGKALGFFCVRFVQLFLVGHPVVSLVDAREKILDDDDASESKDNKTKVRRLYDIANVLVALGLIEKDTGRSGQSDRGGERKPCFVWASVSPLDLLKGDASDDPDVLLKGSSGGFAAGPSFAVHASAAALGNGAGTKRAKFADDDGRGGYKGRGIHGSGILGAGARSQDLMLRTMAEDAGFLFASPLTFTAEAAAVSAMASLRSHASDEGDEPIQPNLAASALAMAASVKMSPAGVAAAAAASAAGASWAKWFDPLDGLPMAPDDMLAFQVERLRAFMADYQV